MPNERDFLPVSIFNALARIGWALGGTGADSAEAQHWLGQDPPQISPQVYDRLAAELERVQQQQVEPGFAAESHHRKRDLGLQQ